MFGACWGEGWASAAGEAGGVGVEAWRGGRFHGGRLGQGELEVEGLGDTGGLGGAVGCMKGRPSLGVEQIRVDIHHRSRRKYMQPRIAQVLGDFVRTDEGVDPLSPRQARR